MSNGKRQKISSKKKLSIKLYWKSFLMVAILTLIYILMIWFKDVSWVKESPLDVDKIIESYDKFMSYIVSPIFIGQLIFSLGLMKELDEEQWKRQEEAEKREKENYK